MPKEALDIEEGANLSITIDVQPPLSDEERIKLTKSAAGSWKGSRDPAELKRGIIPVSFCPTSDRTMNVCRGFRRNSRQGGKSATTRPTSRLWT